MKKEDRILTYEQARELSWFCSNVVGVRLDFYRVHDLVMDFEKRISRLEKTCNLIEKFFTDNNVKPPREEFITAFEAKGGR